MAKIKIKYSKNVENIALIKSPSRAHLTIHGYKILLCNIFVLSIAIENDLVVDVSSLS